MSMQSVAFPARNHHPAERGRSAAAYSPRRGLAVYRAVRSTSLPETTRVKVEVDGREITGGGVPVLSQPRARRGTSLTGARAEATRTGAFDKAKKLFSSTQGWEIGSAGLFQAG